MKAKFVFLALGLAVAGTAFVPAGPVEAKGVCTTKHGKGWAPTQDMAKFQAWEIVAQTTGNWPIATDKLVERKYKCSPDGSGVTCYSWIDVCKS